MENTPRISRIMGLDVGEKRIGIAVSDLLGLTAQPLETYSSIGYGPDVRHMSALCDTWDVEVIVVGLPRNMDGSEGPQADAIRGFAAQLSGTGKEVLFWDERLTTRSAHAALMESGMRRDKRKQVVDQAAAVLILQGFLDAGGLQKSRTSDRVKEPKSDEKTEDTMDYQEPVDNIVELVDEDGETVRFEHLMTLPYEGEEYVVLTNAEATPDSDEGEVFVLRIAQDDQGEDCYVTLEDESIEQAVFDLFMENVEEMDEDAPESE